MGDYRYLLVRDGEVNATFADLHRTPEDVSVMLSRVGFRLSPPRTVVRTMLDTFDGRLHAAGLHLECREGRAIELLLSGVDTAGAMLAVLAVPRMVGDLPPGRFRDRLADAVVDRALLPIVRIRSVCTHAALRDDAGKVVAAATIWDELALCDHDDRTMVPWTVEVEALRGFEKHTRKTCAALTDLGLHLRDHDTLMEAARAVGAHIGGYPGPSDIALERTMPAADGYRAVLSGLADTVAANWQGTIDETDVEFLHDLRIAARRTRTVLGASKSVLPRDVLSNARAQFAHLGSVTGAARDLDVYRVEWATYAAGLDPATVTALEPVQALLRARQTAAHLALANALRDPATNMFINEWREWLADPSSREARARRAEESLAHVVAKRIAAAHGRLVEHGRLIREDTPAQNVHDLRKNAKKLRYLIECFAPLLSDGPRKRFVRRLKLLQDNLGVHQDAEVHVAMLREIAIDLHERGETSATMVAIGQLAERIDQRRLAARAEFADRFAAYDTPETHRELESALGWKQR
jgi:CHAD domain-containing protein